MENVNQRTQDNLEVYRVKRDFAITPEPPGGERERLERPAFVIQKHDASTLHYDVRLEVDGVLKSWAVPKGPSLNPRDKRLAMPTEDHPMGYADFEGVIPAGQYGGGTVIVWDTGTYRNTTQRKGDPVPMAEALTQGHATFALEGHKLRGGWALTRVATGDDERWLLVKRSDDESDLARNVVEAEPMSVLSGRTIEEMAAAHGIAARIRPRGRKAIAAQQP